MREAELIWDIGAELGEEQPTLGGLYRIQVETPGLPQHRIRL